MQAYNGGRVELPVLAQITNSYMAVLADGTNSVVDLSGLRETPGTRSVSLEARNNGSILLPLLVDGSHVSLTLRGMGVIPTAQFQTISSLYAYDGAVINAPGITSWDFLCGGPVWHANGAGSRIVLPGLTNVTSGGCNWWSVQAYNGGQVELPALAQITNSYMSVQADGTNSVVDLLRLRNLTSARQVSFHAQAGGLVRLGGLTELTNNGTSILSEGAGSVVDLSSLVYFNNGTMEARNFGVILTPRLFFLDHATLTVRSGGRLDTRQIHRLLNSTVTIDGMTVTFRDLYNWLGTTFSYPNGGRGDFPPVVDLSLGTVTVQASSLWAGDAFTLSWTGFNSGTNPILGNWTDTVYLSPDPVWDISDVLLGTVSHTTGLEAGSNYTASLTCRAPGVLPGSYHLIVRGDFYNQLNNLASETNQVASSLPVPLAYHPLAAAGGVATGTWETGGGAAYYTIQLPPGKTLLLSLAGSSGQEAGALYVARGYIPTAQTNDYAAREHTTLQELVFTGPESGATYYVLAQAGGSPAGASYVLTAQAGDLIVRRLSTTLLGNASAGSVVLIGAGFDASTVVEFISSTGLTNIASSSLVLSPGALRLDLDLPNWLPGFYDVRVTKGTNVVEISHGFAVHQGGIPRLETHLQVPSAVGFQIPIKQTLWIEYTNSGEVAMPAPLLVVHGDHGARLTGEASLAVPKAGFGTIEGVSDTVVFLGVGNSATPGILQPGESGRIPVYYLGLSEEAHYPQVTFYLNVTTEDDTRPIDWPGLAASMRPLGLTDDEWAVLSQNLRSIVGDVWGQYASLLSRTITQLANAGQPTTDVHALWRFLLLQAAGHLTPVQTLSSSVDAVIHTPAGPLVFQRVYKQHVASRQRLGPLGRGWDHNWNIYIETVSHQPYLDHAVDYLRLRSARGDRWFTKETSLWYNMAGLPEGKVSFIAPPGEFGVMLPQSIRETDHSEWFFDGLDRRANPQQLQRVTDGRGSGVWLGYSPEGLLTNLWLSGKDLFMDYNSQGRLSHLRAPVGSNPANDLVTSYEYDPSG